MTGWVTLSMGQFEEDTAAANKLFVEAVQLVKLADPEKAFRKLNEIIDNYPSTDLAVKLISGQDTGSISLEDVTKEAERAREEAQRSRKKGERAAEEVREEEEESLEFEKTRKAAEQGDAKAQYKLGVMYDYGRGVPVNDAEAVKWYRMAAEQGNELAKYYLEELEAE